MSNQRIKDKIKMEVIPGGKSLKYLYDRLNKAHKSCDQKKLKKATKALIEKFKVELD